MADWFSDDDVALVDAVGQQQALSDEVAGVLARRAGKAPRPRASRRRAHRIVDPDWMALESTQAQFLDEVCRGGSRVFGEGLNTAMLYLPERYGREIPPSGAWIRVTRVPPTRITIPVLSMWYALPEERNPHPKYGYAQHLARILTPQGELCLYPYEYVLVGDIREWVGREGRGVYLRYLDGAAAVDEDKLFYVQSRGIARRDALLLLIGELTSQTFCWFEIHADYARALGMA